ncbi:tripartite ATP-independent transporter DctM subunit [Thalassospira sp. MBR-102]|jgi:tripartite ATP-independent transporter DctM subunit|uniref:TRAP transporter large permease n=1 Tax=Thalassospira TaxID=168934 RepID=UPI00082944C5|nr:MULTISPECIES: TRAP transporter large permease [Thalassospira]MDM7977664.1 TRAP transporter large permease [Thalassospira xiamenensis]OCK09875.1 TRAP dicarboxylate transporter, DctM subunit [Thalassospira sp. KO164]PXX29377.1 tripartite ATP-independent transporter DctM subunit [Thalassospira sp. 11-3]SEE84210.1 TRAP transporter, DctM subunit [Thalassospira permensis]|tara:strand:+ start:5375 stop:6697 length:1323 start_codon:yes stop_codon:yes gene_type:complete
MDALVDFMLDPAGAAIVLFALFFGLLALGTPISIAIGVSSVVTGFAYLPSSVISFVSAQKMFSGIDSFTLLAIPFFVLAGNIMNKGGIAIRLINLAKLLGGRMPGALAHTNVLANMLFGSISGSSIAAAAAVGGVMGPLQRKEGYDPAFSAAVNIASAPTGILIPPSGPLILFSLVSGGTSISALFLGGYLPGILMGLSVMMVITFFAMRRGYRTEGSVGWSEILHVTWQALPPLLMIILVIGGIAIGAFTATEGAAVAVLYSFVLSLMYRMASLQEYLEALKSSAVTSCSILFLIAASGIMSYVMTIAGIPDVIAETILTFDNPIVILLVMNVCLLIIGFFMDLTPAVLIFTPIFLPIATEIGIHPVHLGIIMIFNLGVGSMTPPVGSVLFVGCAVANLRIDQVVRPILPFFFATSAALLLTTYVPWITLALPRFLGLM